jgi:hypothetical protein
MKPPIIRSEPMTVRVNAATTPPAVTAAGVLTIPRKE